MSFMRGTEEYYQKFIELQEKLRRSEEERLVLEMKFNEMVQITREEEQTYYRKLRNQYKRFLEEDRRRQERNERIMRIMERIESRAAILAAKTERFELLRQQYQIYLKRIFADVKENPESRRIPSTQMDIPTISEEKTNSYNHPVIRNAIYGDRHENISPNADLYEHPLVRKALFGNKEDGKSNPKLDVVKQYLHSLSTPISGDAVLKTTRSSEKIPFSSAADFTDSNESTLYKEGYPYYKSNAGNIADQIINSINARPKLSSPYYKEHMDSVANRFSSPKNITKGFYESEDINAMEQLSNAGLSDLRYLHTAKNISDYASVNKEVTKKPEVRFMDLDTVKDDIPKILVEDNSNHSQHSKQGIDMSDSDEYMYRKEGELSNEKWETHTEDEKVQREKIQNEVTIESLPVSSYIDNQNNGDSNKIAEVINFNQVPPTLEDTKEELYPEVANEKMSAETIKNERYSESGRNIIINSNDTLCDENTIENSSLYSKDLQNEKELAIDVQYSEKDEHEQSKEASHQENNISENSALEYAENKESIVEDNRDVKSSVPCDEKEIEISDDNLQSSLQYASNQNEILPGNNFENIDKHEIVKQSSEEEKIKVQSDQKQHGEDTQQYNENNQSAIQYNKDVNSVPEYADAQPNVAYKPDYITSQYNEKEIVNYDREQPVLQYDQNQQPTIQYDENGRPLMQYNEHGQPIMQYDENGVPLTQYDERGQPIMQCDENGQPIMQYDENSRSQYDENGQAIMQYDENGQPIMQYDENAQSIMQYDENGQPIMQYDENGQPLSQYGSDGQPILYDENGQPIMQYDENGQPIMQYDENGQPLYQFDQNESYYPQDQFYGDNTDQQHFENIGEAAEATVNVNELSPSIKELSQVDIPVDKSNKQEVVQNVKDQKPNVMEMLDTDTESIKQDTKVTNDSDFDFSK